MEKEKPKQKTVTPVNDIGLRIHQDGIRLPDIHFYEESGAVLLFASAVDFKGERVDDVLQYLSPDEAMKFANAMKACAIRALENI